MGKGALPLEYLIAFIIAIVVMGTVIYFIYTRSESAGALMTTQELRFYRQGCELRGKTLELQNPELYARLDRDLPEYTRLDRDIPDLPNMPGKRDGYPDNCDFCLGGDDRIDNDDDGIPAACDDNDDPVGGARKSGVSLKKICEKDKHGKWLEESQQCDIRGAAERLALARRAEEAA